MSDYYGEKNPTAYIALEWSYVIHRTWEMLSLKKVCFKGYFYENVLSSCSFRRVNSKKSKYYFWTGLECIFQQVGVIAV